MDPVTPEELTRRIQEIVAAAQTVYDEWDARDPEFGDPEVGFGGICHLIAEAIAEVLGDFPVTTEDASCGEQHTWCMVQIHGTWYHVDIDPYRYESGGGYNWKKKPDVVFTENDIQIYPNNDYKE